MNSSSQLGWSRFLGAWLSWKERRNGWSLGNGLSLQTEPRLKREGKQGWANGRA